MNEEILHHQDGTLAVINNPTFLFFARRILTATNAAPGDYCFDERHDSYCPLPCTACSEECPKGSSIHWEGKP